MYAYRYLHMYYIHAHTYSIVRYIYICVYKDIPYTYIHITCVYIIHIMHIFICLATSVAPRRSARTGQNKWKGGAVQRHRGACVGLGTVAA